MKSYKKFLGIFIVLLAIYGAFLAINSTGANSYISSSAMIELLDEAKSAELDEDFLTLHLKNGQSVGAYASSELLEKASKKLAIIPADERFYKIILVCIIGFILLMMFIAYISRIFKQEQQNQGGTNLVNNIRKVSIEPKQKVKFSDVLGAHAAKAELIKQVSKIHKDAPMKALLFYGASGVGKTMLARALASAADCAFNYASASSFNELYVGMGAKRIRELFAAASAQKPCIIFIDEIDALGASRGNLLNKESEHTLNELLVQMDGFSSATGILLIAATNRYDVLDPALLRRFSKRIEFSLPNEAEREEFVKAYKLSPALSMQQACALTNGFSGADFAAVASELEGVSELSEQAVLAAIAQRRFGLAAASYFSEQQACSEAAIWTVAELLGAECYHVAGRVIWQLNLANSKAKALSEAQIHLAAIEATKHFYDDEFAFNHSHTTAAAGVLRPYLGIDDTGLRASGELVTYLNDAASNAADLIKMQEELISARSKQLFEEAKVFEVK